MIYTEPRTNDTLPYSTVKINGCADSNVEFALLDAQPTVGKRRYCNKVLVHECVSVPNESPLDLTKAEFIATSDNCYGKFEIYKSSEVVDGVESSVDLVTNVDSLVTSVLVKFSSTETCCQPLRLAYRLYGYLAPDNERTLISNGVLYINPCTCSTGECGKEYWTDVVW